ncbi:MAG TPA: hypothetical protein VN629_08865 [Castellaniella sp.]|nr:hypothetical protein [Castellaniella sp.]
MKTSVNAELTKAINRQAHMMAAHSFDAIRVTLENKACALLQEGRSLEEALRAILAADLHHVGVEF